MRSLLLSFVAGLVFGLGLVVSGMTQPSKVINFLDVTGDWDPSLGLVMAGAIGVHALAYRFVDRLPKPLWAQSWSVPTRRDIDAQLLIGAVLFGAGWGLGGYCPGPAITAAITGHPSTLTFTAAMLAGMWGTTLWSAQRETTAAAKGSASPSEECS